MTAPETFSPVLTLTLFGPMQVMLHGQPLPPLRSRQSLWLLALLTLRPDRPVERGWLAGTLWPDSDQSRAFRNLRVVLSELRKALGSEGYRLRTPGRHTLTLDLTGVEVDVRAFDVAIFSREVAAFAEAVRLYRGPLLEGCLEEWVFQERYEREQNCQRALEQLAETALNAGDYEIASGYYQRAVSMDPLHETAQRGWMESLSKSGDRNAALHVYREFIELLRKNDLRAAPDEQTSVLYMRLRSELRQVASASAVFTPESVPRDAVTGYLPHPLTDIIGRENERIEVSARLRHSRLVTMTGMGGIGKTRLTLEVAREVANEYADGVWWVSLEALTEDSLVVPQIASVLGLREEPGQPILQILLDHLKMKHLLLVLDNCEHLLEASAQIVGSLLRECARVWILTTSRQALGITGEMAWAVPALTTPAPMELPREPDAMLHALRNYESVQLFIERAQALLKKFDLTESNALAIAQICSYLDGIPLAIELAAARIRGVGVEQIAIRLHAQFGLLIGGSRAALSRQQTLRATLDWSNDLLSEPERLLLRRLSVFAGGWTLEAAEEVVALEDIKSWQVLDLIISLVDKSLVAFEERSYETGGRYRLLEMVRQYAAESLLMKGETVQIKTRHRDYFLALAQEAEPQLHGDSQGAWLIRLETEHENLRAAIALCKTEEKGAEICLLLVGALWQFWEMHGHYNEGRTHLLGALAREGAGGRTQARARVLNGAGVLTHYQGDYEVARALHEESLTISREIDDKQGIAWPLHHLGLIAARQGDYGTARGLHEESLAIWRELKNSLGIGWSLHQLGSVVREQGEYDTALALYKESLAISRELGDRQGIAWSLNDLGKVACDQGDYRLARSLHEESLAISRELGDSQGIAWSLHHLGNVAGVQGENADSKRFCEESLTIFRASGNMQGVAWTLHRLGEVIAGQGDYETARTLHTESLAIQRKLKNKLGIGWSLTGLGDVAYDRGDWNTAKTLYIDSVNIKVELGDKRGIADSLEGLAAVMLAEAEVQQAVYLWGTARRLRENIGSPLPVNKRQPYIRRVEQARAILGEDMFGVLWEEGCSLTWEQTFDTVEVILTRTISDTRFRIVSDTSLPLS